MPAGQRRGPPPRTGGAPRSEQAEGGAPMKITVTKVERIEATRIHPDPDLDAGGA
ncbi:hypothetical protein ACPFP2_17195 [Micromonospora citrea]|uniref:hypothetical protein n=1 Tax=Micromonospora citrea TaxID=47855 RepID=UPI003C57B1D7